MTVQMEPFRSKLHAKNYRVHKIYKFPQHPEYFVKFITLIDFTLNPLNTIRITFSSKIQTGILDLKGQNEAKFSTNVKNRRFTALTNWNIMT